MSILLQIIAINVCFICVNSLQFGSSSLVQKAALKLKDRFYEIDLQTMSNLNKVLTLFREQNIDTSAFHGVNGYGYGDIGREKLDSVVASLMGAEAALVRLQLFSGTHAIAKALFTSLRPGEKLLVVSGKPYDTLEEVIGLRPCSRTGNFDGSLRDWGISYEEIDLLISNQGGYPTASFDLSSIANKLNADPTITTIHIQRSCGYQWRPSIMISEIKRLCDFLHRDYKSKGRKLTIFCDNCYGELVENKEPCHVGVDLCAGSLIKNLGGTLAPCGGYIAGKKELIASAANHLSAPGVEGGATLNQNRNFFQGLFLASSIVGESIKGAELQAQVFGQELGFECNPPPGGPRTDIIQAIKLEDRDKLIAFCESVHRNSPVGSYIKPIPGMTAGYGSEVIFADGTFIDGSTLELSADGPLRAPYVAFSQGCTHWSHWAIVLEETLKNARFSSENKISKNVN